MTDVRTLDLCYLGRPRVVGCYLAPAGSGDFALIECGPGSALPVLERALAEEGYRLENLRAVLLTHIHLDHGGAAGALARRTGCEVFVHPTGAPHLADPEARLLPSARKLYGAAMDEVWGTMEGVPERLLRVVEHGRPVRVGELEVVGWHTPGHARHHVVWQVEDGVASGDVAGVRYPGSPHVLPPTPPPDIDLVAWRSSLDLLRGLAPRRLLLTHFGPVEDVAWHLDEMEGRLGRWEALARAATERGGSAAELEGELTVLDDAELASEGVDARTAGDYRWLCPMSDAAAGLLPAVTPR